MKRVMKKYWMVIFLLILELNNSDFSKLQCGGSGSTTSSSSDDSSDSSSSSDLFADSASFDQSHKEALLSQLVLAWMDAIGARDMEKDLFTQWVLCCTELKALLSDKSSSKESKVKALVQRLQDFAKTTGVTPEDASRFPDDIYTLFRLDVDQDS